MSSPIVSVILPVYNSEEYLRRCLDSIFSQDGFELCKMQVIAVDDGSSDQSGSILDEYHEVYGDSMIVVHQNNMGSANARNAGMALATGDYLTFIDNDDWFEPDFLFNYITKADSENADIVIGGYRRPANDGTIKETRLPRKGAEWELFSIEPAWAKVYRTSYIQFHKFTFANVNVGEDLPFTIPALLSTERIAFVDYCGYNWFYNPASVSNTLHKSSAGLDFSKLNSIMLGIFTSAHEQSEQLSIAEEYFLIRLNVWFLVYTRKGDNKKQWDSSFTESRSFLDSKVPHWKKNAWISLAHPTGDALASRYAVWLFARHPLLFKVFMRVYKLL